MAFVQTRLFESYLLSNRKKVKLVVWMVGWGDGGEHGWLDGPTGANMDGWMGQWGRTWMVGWTDGGEHGWLDGPAGTNMDGWMDRLG